MRNEDYTEFCELLDSAYDLIGVGVNKVISGGAKGIFFTSMAAYSLPTVRAALSAHCLDRVRGRFTPKPADIIEQIEANDGRRSAEEAWAIALTGKKETDTVVLTPEIIEAFEICRPVLESSGERSARKSFLDAYTRLVAQNRAKQQPVQWFASLGSDKTGRAAAIEKAVAAGLLPAPAISALLAAPVGDVVPNANGLAQLDAIHQMLVDGTEAKERTRLKAVERARFAVEESKRRTNEQVTQYQLQHAARP